MEPVRLLIHPGEGEYEEKKSRFLALALPVKSEAEAQAAILARRKAHPDARHHCYAFVTGASHELMRSSDDGEPSGTGGRPILEALLGSGLHNALVVVTRYFGGTLLGTGGLSRAYSAAACAALQAAGAAELYRGSCWQVMASYGDYTRLSRLLDQMDLAREEAEFGTDVTQRVFLLPEQETAFLTQLADATSGEAVCEKEADCWFLRQEKRAILQDAPFG